MPRYGITTRLDTVSPLLKKIRAAIKTARLMEQIALAGRLALTDFFTEKNAQMSSAIQTTSGKPKLGHLGLFAEFAEAISIRTTAAAAFLSVNHVAVRQRVFGGTIRPTGGRRYLAIPAAQEAYGKRPRGDYDGKLKFGLAAHPDGGWRPALVRDVSAVKSRKRKGQPPPSSPFVLFWLIRQAVQKPDPTAMIGRADLGKAIKENLDGYIGGK